MFFLSIYPFLCSQHPSHGTVTGEVLTFGTGDTGQLGLGEVMERKKPALVTLEDVDDGMVQVCLCEAVSGCVRALYVRVCVHVHARALCMFVCGTLEDGRNLL